MIKLTLTAAFFSLPMLITLPVASFTFSPVVVRAVTPPPDGGYPGRNTAEGTDALFSLTTSAGVTVMLLEPPLALKP